MSLNYEEACKLIYDLPKFTTKHTPEDSRTFLRELGSPERDMRMIHVAGTNGKGSVCVYMESILMHAGMKTGCFVSPHLVTMNERIRINGLDCSEEDFAWAAGKVKDLADRLFYPSFFEFLFFMGMLIFRKEKVDILILETGLGGRLDATNLPEKKELAVITSIGMDHCEYLGDTLPEIAEEKAGIMRKGVPVVYWGADEAGTEEEKAAAARLHECADRTGSVEYALSERVISHINVDNSAIDFDLHCGYDINMRLFLPTRGLYQVKNGALAVCALHIWDSEHVLKEADYTAGLSEIRWNGRMEEIFPGTFLDGAHNVPAVKALLATVSEDGADRRMLVFGCMRDKQYTAEIGLILDSGLFDRIETVDIDSPRAESAEKLAMVMENMIRSRRDSGRAFSHEPEVVCIDASEGRSMEHVVDDCRSYTTDNDSYAYIAGSLYLVGEVRGFIDDRF